MLWAQETYLTRIPDTFPSCVSGLSANTMQAIRRKSHIASLRPFNFQQFLSWLCVQAFCFSCYSWAYFSVALASVQFVPEWMTALGQATESLTRVPSWVNLSQVWSQGQLLIREKQNSLVFNTHELPDLTLQENTWSLFSLFMKISTAFRLSLLYTEGFVLLFLLWGFVFPDSTSIFKCLPSKNQSHHTPWGEREVYSGWLSNPFKQEPLSVRNYFKLLFFI